MTWNGQNRRFLIFIKGCLLVLLISQMVHTYPQKVEQRIDSSSNSSLSIEENGSSQLRFPRDDWGMVRRNVQKVQNPRNESELNSSVQRNTMGYQNSRMSGDRPQGRMSSDNQRGASSSNTMLSNDAIVFPTERPMVVDRTDFLLKNVPTCEGSTYCETVPDYPENLVNEAIRSNEILKNLGTVDEVSDIIQRIDVADDDAVLCLSQEQVIYPKTAENKQKEWLFIINQKDLKQGIRIETCTNENSDCRIVGGLLEGYEMSCKQKYVYRQLMAIHGNNTIAPDTFRFPSSCCCHAKLVGNPLTRLGIGPRTQKNPVTPVRTRRRN